MSFLNSTGEITILGSPLISWLIALSSTVILSAAFKIFKTHILKRNITHGVVKKLLSQSKWFILAAIALQFGFFFLNINDQVMKHLKHIFLVLVMLQTALWGTTLIQYWIDSVLLKNKEKDVTLSTTAGLMSFLIKTSFYILIALVIISNLGFDITAIVAGLGVGGIAVALALQNILGDLFASLTIVLDKPFVVGDTINVDDLVGRVEHIGLKTTRLRSQSGEQLIFPNSNLLQSRIRNFKRMHERRVIFTLGFVYGTPLDSLKKIPKIVQELVETQPKTRFERCHFLNYAESSLNFEVVYWVLDSEFNIYTDIHHTLNLALYQRFAAEGLDFAFPTRTVHLKGGA